MPRRLKISTRSTFLDQSLRYITIIKTPDHALISLDFFASWSGSGFSTLSVDNPVHNHFKTSRNRHGQWVSLKLVIF